MSKVYFRVDTFVDGSVMMYHVCILRNMFGTLAEMLKVSSVSLPQAEKCTQQHCMRLPILLHG